MKEVDDLRQELNQHIEKCDRQFNEGNARFDEIVKLCKDNNETSEENNAKIQLLVQNTDGMTSFYRDMEGAIRLGATMQRFGVWVIKWPLIGTGIYAAYKWFIDITAGQ